MQTPTRPVACGVALGRVAGALLVADEDVAHRRRVHERVVGRQDRAAGDAEDDVDSGVLQRADQALGSGDLVGHVGPRRGSWVGGRSKKTPRPGRAARGAHSRRRSVRLCACELREWRSGTRAYRRPSRTECQAVTRPVSSSETNDATAGDRLGRQRHPAQRQQSRRAGRVERPREQVALTQGAPGRPQQHELVDGLDALRDDA